MVKRFSVRKVKINSYSRQGWVMSHCESYAVYDRMWKQRPRGFKSEWDVRNEFMYVQFTEWGNKAFVQAIANYLNETVGLNCEVVPDGFHASQSVLKRDVGYNGYSDYSEWCKKFGGEAEDK